MCRLLQRAILIAASSTLLAAGSAAAATRYAAPGAGGPEPCTSSAPCSIDTAVESAHSGDDVVVAPGDYSPAGGTAPNSSGLCQSSPTGALHVISGVTVHGVDGQPAPRISSGASTCATIDYVNATLSHLQIESVHIGIYGGGGSSNLNRIYAHATGVDAPIEISDGTVLRNSIAVPKSSNAWAIVGLVGSTQLHNVTAVGTVQLSDGAAANLTATNVIASKFQAGGNGGSASSTISFNHSIGQCSPGANDTCSNGGGNQPGPANFFDPANQNYHERSPSPSIDTGTADPASGGVDFDGGPRANGTTDIGADEYGSPAPAVTTGAATGITQTSATVSGTVNPGGQPTGAFFEYGPTPSFGAQTPQQDVGDDFSTHSLSANLVGLAPGTTYYYRLASTAGGSRGEQGSLTTPPANMPPPDSDGDGLPDASDTCPALSDAGAQRSPRNGCPAVPPDRVGTGGGDVLTGDARPNVICGLAGNDTLNGLAGNDTLWGDACGAKTKLVASVTGRGGNDKLYGGDGNDRLYGAAGNDTLSGGRGNDRLFGGNGNDKLIGGAGTNTYSGGAGNDSINARNGKKETVDCGSGKKDSAIVDKRDNTRGCERVKRARR